MFVLYRDTEIEKTANELIPEKTAIGAEMRRLFIKTAKEERRAKLRKMELQDKSKEG
jgi:hypothetical protein